MNAAYIQIDGTPVDDALLADVTVTQALNTHWWCQIDLRQTEDKRFSAEEMLGKDLRIATYDNAGAEQVIFAGLIVESELEFEIFGSYTGRIAAVSKSYLLDLTRRRNYFSAETAKAVAEELTSGVNLALEGEMKAGSSRDFFQLEETDFQFLLRLVDDSEAWLRPTESGIEVQSAFQKSVALNWRAEGGLVQFKVKGRLSQPSCDGAQYDPVAMESKTFEEIGDSAEFSGAAARMVSAVVNQSKSLLPSTYIGQRSRAVTVTAYQDLLKKESRRSMGRSVTCSGESREPLLRAGNQVKIEGVLDAQGTYGITRVVHHWDSAGYTNQFECTPWTKYTNPDAPQLRRCHGIVPARVTDNNDPENQGRVRVQFYWQEDSETTWLPMMAPHAGADRGFMFLPEVGDEVWVAFEEGDPERGRVLGCAWNGVQKPPREEFWGGDVAPNDVKRIVTKSGHRISIVDKDGKSSIVLATPKHVKVSLIENSNETGDSMLALHSDGDIFLSAPNGRIHFHSKYFSREVGGSGAPPSQPLLASSRNASGKPAKHHIEEIKPTRKKGDSGFDETKMYETFSKSKSAKALEKDVTAKGYRYAGNVDDPKSSAYTDPVNHEIKINQTQSTEQAALAYAYELQNAKNGENYNAIFADARSGKIKDGTEFARQIMNHEAEALEFEAKAAMEMGLEAQGTKGVIDIVKNTADEAERKKQILKWADSSGQIKGMKPSDYYKKMYEDQFAKKP